MVKIRLFNYAYFNIFDNPYDRDLECPILVICGREENKNFHTFKIPGRKGIFRPHFFVLDADYNRKILSNLLKEGEILEWGEWNHHAIYDEDEKVLVVYTQFPYQVKNVKKRFINTYQADINYEDLFIMMLGLESGYFECPDKEWIEPEEIKPLPDSEHFYVESRIMVFDIETRWFDKSKRFNLDNQEIISIVAYDNYENTYFRLEWDNYEKSWTERDFVKRRFIHKDIPLYSYQITEHCKSEKELLIYFFELFKKRYDGELGFNSHGGIKLKSVKAKTERRWSNGFDEPVVFKRAMKNGLEKEMQQMSPLPIMKNIYGRYYGVYTRGKGEKFEVVVRGLTPLDFHIAEPLMKYTEKYRDFFGRKLDNYLRYFSNFHKVKHTGLTVAELKKVDLQKELYYNKIDVEGTLFLDYRFGFSRDIFDSVALSLVKGIDILSATKIHNFLTLKESKDYCVYDTKSQVWDRNLWQGWLEQKKDEYGIIMKKKNKAGGYNVPMKRGSREWYVLFDFSGFYPTLAYSSNAGIDTLIQVKREFKNHYRDNKGRRWHKSQCIITPAAPFRKDKESIERRIWGKLLNIKKQYKKDYEKALEEYKDPNHPIVRLYYSKVYNLKGRLINNKYGASGNNGYIAKNYAIYNVMPTLAQCCIKGIEKEFLPQINYNPLLGDTDSIGIELKCDNLEESIKEADDLTPKLNNFIDMFLKREFNIDENIVEIGWEKIGPNFYGHAAKNYAMEVWVEDGKKLPENKRYILYKGFELKKANRSDYTELIQKIFLDIGLHDKKREEQMEKLTALIHRVEEVFKHPKYLDWIKICSRINIQKPLKEYVKNYINKRSAEFTNETIKTDYGEGDNGFLAYLNLPKVGGLKQVCMFNKKDIIKLRRLGYELNYGEHKEKFVVKKLNLLLKDLGTDYYSLLRRSQIKDVCVL